MQEPPTSPAPGTERPDNDGEHWVKARCLLFDHPNTIAVAGGINLGDVTPLHSSQLIAMASLLRLWMWANEHTEDGFLPGLTASGIDAAVGIAGFGDALLSTGWAALETDPAGVTLVNFHTWNVPVRSRPRPMTGAERMRLWRQRHQGNPQSVTPAPSRRDNAVTTPTSQGDNAVTSLLSTSDARVRVRYKTTTKDISSIPGTGGGDLDDLGRKAEPDPQQPFDVQAESAPAPPTDPRILPQHSPDTEIDGAETSTPLTAPETPGTSPDAPRNPVVGAEPSTDRELQIVQLLKKAGVASAQRRDMIAREPGITPVHIEQATAYVYAEKGGPGMIVQMLCDPDWRRVTDKRVAEVKAEAGRRTILAEEARERAERDARTVSERADTLTRWQALSDADAARCRAKALELWAGKFPPDKFPPGTQYAPPAEFESDPNKWEGLHRTYAKRAMDEVCHVPGDTLKLEAETA